MKRKPNILHLFVDQQRFDTIRALGNSIIKTPNLDRLCREGVAFTNGYSPSPVCVSARCSMIMGQYPMNTGCMENSRMPTDERQTFMDALTLAGYRTHGIGKCHFTPDSHALRGFQSRERQEENGAHSLEGEDYLIYLKNKGYDHLCEPMGVRGEMYYIPQPSQLPPEDHPTQWIADRSIAFIEQESKTQQPWYLFSSFIHPHPPFAPPNPWHKLYRAPLMPLPNVPADVESLQTYVNRFQNRYKYRDQGLDTNLLRCMKAYYYACISFVDYQIGRILDGLETAGQLDNTLILFTTDHGEHLGDYNCFGKRSMHDSCARIPFIVRQPGQFEGGIQCDTPVSLVDIAPTFLQTAGAKIDSHSLDGVDLAQLLTGNVSRDHVFAQLAPGRISEVGYAATSTYMAVSREWKYFYSAPDNQEYLFDKIHDPQETRNKAGLSLCQKPLKQIRGSLMAYLRETGTVDGLNGDAWKELPKLHVPTDPDAGLLIQDGYTPWVDTNIPGYSDEA